MKLKMTFNTMSKYLIAQLQYVKQSWVKGGGERYKRKQAARWYKNLCGSKVLDWRNSKRISSCHERGTKKKFWVPMRNRTSDLRIPRSNALPLSHRLYDERGLLRSSYDKRPAYCLDQQSLGLFANVIFLSQNFILTISIASPTWFLIKNLPSNLIKPLH